MSVSISSALRTCKAETEWANRWQSDRFLNPHLVVAPRFNGNDNYGRLVCPDSYKAKTAGGSSSLDRVAVENFLRPEYSEFVTLDLSGLQGYDSSPSKTSINSLYNQYLLQDIEKCKQGKLG